MFNRKPKEDTSDALKEHEARKQFAQDFASKEAERIEHENPTKGAAAVSVKTEAEVASTRLRKKLDVAFADLKANLLLARADVMPDTERARFTHQADAWLDEIKAFLEGTHGAAR